MDQFSPITCVLVLDYADSLFVDHLDRDPIVKNSLAAILEATLSGSPAEQIATLSTDIVLKIFGRDISMGKGQGL